MEIVECKLFWAPIFWVCLHCYLIYIIPLVNRALKQHRQCIKTNNTINQRVRNSFLVNFPPRAQRQSRLKDYLLLIQPFRLPTKIFNQWDTVSKQVFRKEIEWRNWFQYSLAKTVKYERHQTQLDHLSQKKKKNLYKILKAPNPLRPSCPKTSLYLCRLCVHIT